MQKHGVFPKLYGIAGVLSYLIYCCFFTNHEHYLQSYQENDNCLYRMTQAAESNAVKPGGAELFGAFSREELEQMAELVRKYVGKVVLRGVVGT